MRIDKEHKLDFFKALYENAQSQTSGQREDFDKWSKQYKGDLEIDDSTTPAKTCKISVSQSLSPSSCTASTAASITQDAAKLGSISFACSTYE